jgi:CheY-like chemotaxis protein
MVRRKGGATLIVDMAPREWNKGARSDSTSVPLILLIEDNPNDVFLFRRALGKLGFIGDVRTAASVSEAKAYMEHASTLAMGAYHRSPQLIVSDFRLGGQTATEFVQWLRSQSEYKSIPVVMLSGLVSAINEADFADLDVRSFLRKTPDVSALGLLLQPLIFAALGREADARN